MSRGKDSHYFKSAFLGYTVGLVLTIIVMNWFQAAQVTIGTPHLCFIHLDMNLSWESSLTLFYCLILITFLTIPFQPALLYIVPAVIGFLAAHCIWNGEVKQVCSSPYIFSYLHSIFSFISTNAINFIIMCKNTMRKLCQRTHIKSNQCPNGTIHMANRMLQMVKKTY